MFFPNPKCPRLSVKQRKTKEPNYFVLTSKEVINMNLKQKHGNGDRNGRKLRENCNGNKLQRP